MRGDARVIEYLNKALRHELAAVNQYWLHYRILDNWGYKDFAKTWRKDLIKEMQHADMFVARILFLDGQPNMQSLDQLRIGSEPEGDYRLRSPAEIDARALYLEAADYCDPVHDRITKNLFEALTADEEEHIDFLEAQLTLIEQLGRSALRPKACRRARGGLMSAQRSKKPMGCLIVATCPSREDSISRGKP